MGPVGAKTRRRAAGTGLETRERWGTLLHSILDTYARTCTLWLAYVRTSVLRDREAAGLLIGRILPIERTRGLSRSLSLPPREPFSINHLVSISNVPVRGSNGRLDSVCPSPIYLVRFTPDFTVSDIRFQLISSPPWRNGRLSAG